MARSDVPVEGASETGLFSPTLHYAGDDDSTPEKDAPLSATTGSSARYYADATVDGASARSLRSLRSDAHGAAAPKLHAAPAARSGAAGGGGGAGGVSMASPASLRVHTSRDVDVDKDDDEDVVVKTPITRSSAAAAAAAAAASSAASAAVTPAAMAAGATSHHPRSTMTTTTTTTTMTTMSASTTTTSGAAGAAGGGGGLSHSHSHGHGASAAAATAASAAAVAAAAAAAAATAAATAAAAAAAAAEEEEETGYFEEFNPYLFIKLLPPYKEVSPYPARILLPPKSRTAPKVSLALDLDETLVHCSIDPVPDADLTFPVDFNGATYQVYVRKRPFLDKFLKYAASKFEVTVFTASQRVYAEKLLDIIDPRRDLIDFRLYRDACLNVDGNFLKDLSVLGRDLSKTVLVDNSPHAFGYQVDNGIPIESWFDDPRDTELLKLRAFLETIAHVDDVRPHVRAKFRVHDLIAAAL